MRTLSLAVLFALAVAAGCSAPSDPASDAPPPAAAVPVAVSEARYDGLVAALEDRKGKVVLMDFWATWCGPCVKKFPHLIATHKKYADKGLVCMSVSLDPHGRNEVYEKADVLAFLKKHDATFPNFVLMGRAADDAKIVQRFGLNGSIPFLALFNKSGERVWDSEQSDLSDAELDQRVEAELAK